MRFVFITGTDTDCGKTFIASSIIKGLSGKEIPTIGFKPVASGASDSSSRPECSRVDVASQQLVNSDALALYLASTLKPPYHVVNPYCFAPAIAPHVAAQEAGVKVTAQALNAHLGHLTKAYPQHTTQQPVRAEVAIVEGAGGWAVPLNDNETIGQWAAEQGMGVILVVALKLGCINHAMLSVAAIEASGAKLLGWVANQVSPQPMQRQQQTLQYLTQQIKAPLLKHAEYSDTALTWREQELAHLITAIGCNHRQREA